MPGGDHQELSPKLSQVLAYDGRGGVDVLVRQGTRLRIFQLKYFGDGFGSDHRKHRRQIKDSFMAAVNHDPTEWILVIPTNPTPGEEKFVLDLSQDRPDLVLRIMGRQQLDSHLSRFPDLTEYFVRDSLLHHAKILGQKKALRLGGLSDLTERTRALAGVADTLDLDWGVDTAMRDGVVVHTVRPKHERAARNSPRREASQSCSWQRAGPDLGEPSRRQLRDAVAQRVHRRSR
uniref:hypothetical protein n=1 Tax=Paractinoplanes polyasparticus TaxID=2856853 RepID=UPI001C850CD9|nr:hypothetical protein [Actinoplanes polyasparticus]